MALEFSSSCTAEFDYGIEYKLTLLPSVAITSSRYLPHSLTFTTQLLRASQQVSPELDGSATAYWDSKLTRLQRKPQHICAIILSTNNWELNTIHLSLSHCSNHRPTGRITDTHRIGCWHQCRRLLPRRIYLLRRVVNKSANLQYQQPHWAWLAQASACFSGLSFPPVNSPQCRPIASFLRVDPTTLLLPFIVVAQNHPTQPFFDIRTCNPLAK